MRMTKMKMSTFLKEKRIRTKSNEILVDAEITKSLLSM